MNYYLYAGHKIGSSRVSCLSRILVLLLDGNSEIGAFVRNSLSHLICARHLISSKAFTIRIFFFSPKGLFSLIVPEHVLSLLSSISYIVNIIHVLFFSKEQARREDFFIGE